MRVIWFPIGQAWLSYLSKVLSHFPRKASLSTAVRSASSFETCLIMRRDDDSKLINEFARAFLRKYVQKLRCGRQMQLPLSA